MRGDRSARSSESRAEPSRRPREAREPRSAWRGGAGGAAGRLVASLPDPPQPIFEIRSNIGMYIATTIVPMIAPRIAIMIGSISFIRPFDGVVDLFLVELGDLGEHGVEGAGLLADADHLDDHRREDLRLGERLGDRPAGLDGLADGHDRVLDDRVARRLRGDLEAVEDRDAGRGQRRERPAEAGDGDLLHDVAEDRQLQDDPVDDAAPLVGRVVALQGEDRPPR